MKKMFYVPLAAIAFGGFVATSDAKAQEVAVTVEAPMPPPVYVDAPPAYVVAGVEPIYYEGRPCYWYGGRWYYRDGARWTFYGREPRFLADRRGRGLPAPHYYAHGGHYYHGGHR